MQKLIDMEGVREEIQDKLRDYLTQKGIKIDQNGSAKFSCIVPSHRDSNPSANIIPGTNYREWKCHGCGCHGDIFTAAHLLEKKPIEGEAFLEENVLYLAQKFGIEVKLAELSDEEKIRFRARSAYRWTARYLLEQPTGQVFKDELKSRRWDQDPTKLTEMGIGEVSDYDRFRRRINSAGFEDNFLEEIGLGSKAKLMFGQDRMVFTIYDVHGRPVAFTSRDLLYEHKKIDPSFKGQKYYNSTNTTLFKKGHTLYNIDKAVRVKHRKVFIFEGATDVVTYRVFTGQDNCVATLGNAVTEHHVDTLVANGIAEVVICFDGDAGGHKGLTQAVKAMSGHAGLYVNILELPSMPDENDVDSFIRKHGAKGWYNAHEDIKSMFRWKIEATDVADADPTSTDKYTKLNGLLDVISNELVPFKRQQMLHELANLADTAYDDLASQLNFKINQQKAELEHRRQALITRGVKTLKDSPTDARLIVGKLKNDLEHLEDQFGQDLLDPGPQIAWVEEARRNQKVTNTDHGLKTGWHKWDQAFDGSIIHEGTLIYVGGKPNTGKTSLTANLAIKMLGLDPDVVVMVYTIDDSKLRYLNRFAASLADIPTLCITKPNIAPEHQFPIGMDRTEIIGKGDNAMDKIKATMQAGRLHIMDAVDGQRQWGFADTWCEKMRRHFPEKKLVLFLDNFHNLGDYGGMDFRIRYSELSRQLKDTAARNNMCIISTVHYTKLQDRVKPTNFNIAETVSLEYDADAIVHLCNHKHEFRSCPDDLKVFWDDATMRDDPGSMLDPHTRPVVEFGFGKSKISGFKGAVFYKFDELRCRFIEGTNREHQEWQEADKYQKWIR
jgi:DNA primase catalytic core